MIPSTAARLDQALRLSGIPIHGVGPVSGPFLTSGNVRIDFNGASPAQVSGAFEILLGFDFTSGGSAQNQFEESREKGSAGNDFDTSGSRGRVLRAVAGLTVDELNILRRQVIAVGTFAWDPANLADGAGLTRSDITVSGVQFGDFVNVAAPYTLQGVLCNSYVHGSGTLGVRLQNETGAAVNLANGNWNYAVWRPEQMAPRTDAQARNAVFNRISGG